MLSAAGACLRRSLPPVLGRRSPTSRCRQQTPPQPEPEETSESPGEEVWSPAMSGGRAKEADPNFVGVPKRGTKFWLKFRQI